MIVDASSAIVASIVNSDQVTPSTLPNRIFVRFTLLSRLLDIITTPMLNSAEDIIAIEASLDIFVNLVRVEIKAVVIKAESKADSAKGIDNKAPSATPANIPRLTPCPKYAVFLVITPNPSAAPPTITSVAAKSALRKKSSCKGSIIKFVTLLIKFVSLSSYPYTIFWVLWSNSSGSPFIFISPSTRATTLVARGSTVVRSWVAIITVVFFLDSSVRVSIISFDKVGSAPDVGSSHIITSDDVFNALAISTR